jgi:hypothetical protein
MNNQPQEELILIAPTWTHGDSRITTEIEEEIIIQTIDDELQLEINFNTQD